MEKEVNYAKEKTLSVLNKIQELIKFAPEGDLLRYKITDFFNSKNRKNELSSVKEDEILHDLQKWGALIIDDKERIDNELIYYLKILPKFEKLYLDHKNTLTEVKKVIGETAKSTLMLSLNKNGDLWREPKNKYCYKMGEKSDRCKIIRYLADNNGYRQTLVISSVLGGKDAQSIRTEIAKIRSKAKYFLNVDGKKFLEGRKGSGYRIGLGYKIRIEKEE